MSQALARRGYPFLLVRVRAVRSLCSHAAGGGASYGGGGERWRGHPQQQEESKAVKVSVWWDFENCAVPQNVNVCRVAQRVSAALRAAGVRGPLSITAFGDVQQLSRATQEALAATGVAISHVPSSCVISHLPHLSVPSPSVCEFLVSGKIVLPFWCRCSGEASRLRSIV
jgi:hypothetical protein